MPVLVFCKFDEDLIKNVICYCPDNIFSFICLLATKGQLILLWIVRSAPKIKLVQDLFQIKNSIKNNRYCPDNIFQSL